jgi:hypothetical protein
LWSNFRIQQVSSDKLFFKKYHFKMEITVSLAAFLRSKNGELTEQKVRGFVTAFRNISYNYGGSWKYFAGSHATSIAESKSTDVSEIIDIGNIIRAVPDLKYTVLDSSIHMFSDSEQELYDIASKIHKKVGRLGQYAAIWTPDPSTLTAIEEGYEILSRDPGYTHKVVLREKRIGIETKLQIYNYLTSLGNQIKISKSVERMFKSRGSYLYAGWFRTNDPSIATFLELISPGIIQKIMPVHVKNK